MSKEVHLCEDCHRSCEEPCWKVDHGLLVELDEKTALALAAGARAIENNKRLCGAMYCWDVFGVNGEPKEISYYEAANILRHLSEPLFAREEADAALEAREGQDG